MESIRIKNLRCLKDTGDIVLKPITMLVGTNSSGKSTFLRTFPLFKQGTNVNKQGPILWYGAEVDFGSFHEAIRRGEETMEFSFKWGQLNVETYYTLSLHTVILEDVQCTVKIVREGEDAFVKELHIDLFGDLQIDIVFLKTKVNLFVNGRKMSQEKGFNIMQRSSARAILPIISVNFPNESSFFNPIPFSLVQETIGNIPHFNNTFNNTKREETFVPKLSTQKEMLSNVCQHYEVENDESILRDPHWQQYSDIVTYANLQGITDTIERTLQQEFSSVYYIKPFRASAERYYRQQNLAVRDLDSDGHNMAMFVDNMFKDPTIEEKFCAWTKENFDFVIKPVRQGGHLSIAIIDRVSQRNTIKEEDYRNMTDKGFGYSQILPIILTLWQIFSSSPNKNISKGTIFAVYEQPELHLHPRMQAVLMDAIISTVKVAIRKNIDVKFIIETHSPVMINRLGLRVGLDDEMSSNMTSVLLFDENKENSPNISEFNSQGRLINWPIGFFEPNL